MSDRQQVAVAVIEVGKPVQKIKRSIPLAQQDELLIKVEAAHLLPHDSYCRDWGLFVADKLPWVPAANIAGIIQEVGPSTSGTDFHIGDRIFGMGSLARPQPDESGLQEYAILSINAAAKIPSSVKTEDAVTIPINLATSFLALFSEDFGFGFPAPWEKQNFDFTTQTLVVIGAGSNVAKLGIQLAKIVGIGRIIAIAGLSNAGELKRFGATHIIDRHESSESIAQQVHAITGPEGATKIYHCYNFTLEPALSILPKTKPSRLIVVHPVDPEEIKQVNPLCSVDYVDGSNGNLRDLAPKFWKSLPEWIEAGEVLPAPWKVIGGLNDLVAINHALDVYRDATGGPQAIVKP